MPLICVQGAGASQLNQILKLIMIFVNKQNQALLRSLPDNMPDMKKLYSKSVAESCLHRKATQIIQLPENILQTAV